MLCPAVLHPWLLVEFIGTSGTILQSIEFDLQYSALLLCSVLAVPGLGGFFFSFLGLFLFGWLDGFCFVGF